MLITLLLKIEEKFGKKVKVSSDFFNLSIDISRDTNNSISPATLKRIWGYVNDSHVPREFTLDVLSAFCGYTNYQDFLNHDVSTENASGIISENQIDSNRLIIGQKIMVSWHPDRKCIFSYLGESKFIIALAENSKLKAGMTFTTTIFIMNHPLYMHKLADAHQEYGLYEAGKLKGITALKII